MTIPTPAELVQNLVEAVNGLPSDCVNVTQAEAERAHAEVDAARTALIAFMEGEQFACSTLEAENGKLREAIAALIYATNANQYVLAREKAEALIAPKFTENWP